MEALLEFMNEYLKHREEARKALSEIARLVAVSPETKTPTAKELHTRHEIGQLRAPRKRKDTNSTRLKNATEKVKESSPITTHIKAKSLRVKDFAKKAKLHSTQVSTIAHGVHCKGFGDEIRKKLNKVAPFLGDNQLKWLIKLHS